MRWRDRKRPCFKKLDTAEAKWTHGRSCFKLPGRVIVTPTNFKNVAYLNLDDYSYNYFYRPSDYGSVPKAIAEEYFHCKYLRSRDPDRHQEFSDLEARHFSDTRMFMTYEYDFSVLMRLVSKWDPQCLKKYLEYYRRTSYTIDFKRSSLVYTMFTPVVGKYCDDSALVVAFFRTLCSHLIACESIFMGSTPFLKLFLDHALKVGFNPWSLMRKFQRQKDSSLVKFCPVEWSFVQGKLEHLELLLKYGCPFHLSNYSASIFNKKIDGRWWNRNRPAAITMPGSPTPPSPSSEEFRRSAAYTAHFTVALYLTANNAVVYGGEDANRFASSIRLFMRSVPQPYVSPNDMQDILGLLAPTIFPIVSMSCDWYRSTFPEYDTPSTRSPRSLMHLSRCAVRGHCQLPQGLPKLPLPEYLKSYLNLEW